VLAAQPSCGTGAIEATDYEVPWCLDSFQTHISDD
jgi:hypothetical protein